MVALVTTPRPGRPVPVSGAYREQGRGHHMSRSTDTERGARIALEASLIALHPDLFPDCEIWQGIFVAASEQIAECNAYRAALRCSA